MTDAMQERFDLDGFLPYQLAIVAERVSRRFSTLYKREFGISIPEWRVIAHLSQRDQVSVGAITDKVGMDKPKVSRAASRLEKAGYLTKSVNPDDRRLVSLCLTPKGRDLMDRIAPMAMQFEAEVMDDLGADGPAFRKAIRTLIAAGD